MTINCKEKLKASGKLLIDKVGYFSTNSNEIARSAGLAAGTFYNHYKNKEELFLDVYKDWHEEQRSAIQAIVLEALNDQEFTRKIVDILQYYYGRNVKFRSSIHSLKLTSTKVYDFRLEQRKILLGMISQIVKLRKIKRSKDEILLFQMSIERFFDAYALGEFRELGYSKAKEKQILHNFFHQFCTGKNYSR